jgi:hypothetical protein
MSSPAVTPGSTVSDIAPRVSVVAFLRKSRRDDSAARSATPLPQPPEPHPPEPQPPDEQFPSAAGGGSDARIGSLKMLMM